MADDDTGGFTLTKPTTAVASVGKTPGDDAGGFSLDKPIAPQAGFAAPAAPQGFLSRVASDYGKFITRPGSFVGQSNAEDARVDQAITANPTAQDFVKAGSGPGATHLGIDVGAGFAGAAPALEAAGAVKEAVKDIGPSLARAQPKDTAVAAHEAGYVVPPREAAAGEPSQMSKVLGGLSGRVKTDQAASVKNQEVTSRLAAQELGLHPDTVLTDKVFDDVRKEAGGVYREVEQAVPDIQPDREFHADVDKIGGEKNVELEKLFPSMKENPGIQAMRDELKSVDKISTGAAMKAISDFRYNASTNLKKPGDPQAHALGLAQREAANAVEELIERRVQNAPDYYADQFHDALGKQGDAVKRVAAANQKLTLARSVLAKESNIYVSAAAMKAERAAMEELAKAHADLESGQQAVETWRTRLQNAHVKNADNQTLLDRFRDARQLFAKSYDIQGATNPTTGEVNARAIARIGNKGRPLTGKLRTIMDAANAFPKAMQSPTQFGGAEDWSALDFYGMAASALHGNPGIAAGIFSRPIARSTILSPGYQKAIMGSRPNSAQGAADMLGITQ